MVSAPHFSLCRPALSTAWCADASATRNVSTNVSLISALEDLGVSCIRLQPGRYIFTEARPRCWSTCCSDSGAGFCSYNRGPNDWDWNTLVAAAPYDGCDCGGERKTRLRDLALMSAGSGPAILDAAALPTRHLEPDTPGQRRTFAVHKGVRLLLRNVVLTGGQAPLGHSGGGLRINNGACVLLMNTSVSGNVAGPIVDGQMSGGGIANYGSATLIDSHVDDNNCSGCKPQPALMSECPRACNV
jgi:hypothetical protein